MAKGGKGGGTGSGGGGGGKGGGGKGGGGKGGGGKGKKGGGCAPGQIATLCLSLSVFQAVKDAFNHAVTSAGGTDTCPAGSMKVRLECTVAQQLVFGTAVAMQTNVSKKPKGKKGGK
jgi:hypothetical protein